MNLTQSFFEALESLSGNKLRSGLTVLGIVIGVAAVIAMLAVGQGAEDAITGSINGIGTNLLFVFRGGRGGGPGGPGEGPPGRSSSANTRPLTMSDAAAIADPLQAPSVAAVAPTIQTGGEVSYGGEKTNTTIVGATASYFAVRNTSVAEGNLISQENILGRASVVLLGPDVADALFGHRDGLIGEMVRISGQPFRVIGVLTSKGGGAMGSEDNTVIIPLSTAQARLVKRGGVDQVDVIFVQATAAETVTTAADEISQILRQRHRSPVGEDDFTVFTQQDMLSTMSSITGVLTIFLGGIAAISLLVGGIGIMNIMLVSVTERTREIGLRKALGARKRGILVQFLTESSVLSLVGGIIGIMFGWLIAFIVGRVAEANEIVFVPAVSADAILLAVLFSTAIGLFFGIYPASRAANLVPVEALRYE